MHEQLTNTNTSVTSSFSLTACARGDCVFRSRRFVLVASRKAERTFDIVSSAMDHLVWLDIAGGTQVLDQKCGRLREVQIPYGE